MQIKRPPLRYPGGKWRLAPWIIEKFPPHVTYVEPFCGGAGVFFRKQPSEIEVINDLNDDVVNFFEVLRNRPDELARALELTPHSRTECKQAFASESADPLERARTFFVRCSQSFGSGMAKPTGWRYGIANKRGLTIPTELSNMDHLMAAAGRLKMAQIECDDALGVIARYDTPDTLFYVDPPYVRDTRRNMSRDVYSVEMNNDDHSQLAEVLHDVAGHVVVSGYPSDLYSDLYAGWPSFSRETNTNGQGRATEVLWVSPRAVSNEVLPLWAGEIA